MTVTKNEYGDQYNEHLLEQYKLYVEMTDRISNRRQTANSFFLSVNTAIIALIGYQQIGTVQTSTFHWLVSIAGIVNCYIWYRLLRSYRDLNSAKFKVIHDMEVQLPFAPYDLEWEKVERGNNPALYLPFTKIEGFVPWAFMVIHLFATVYLF